MCGGEGGLRLPLSAMTQPNTPTRVCPLADAGILKTIAFISYTAAWTYLSPASCGVFPVVYRR